MVASIPWIRLRTRRFVATLLVLAFVSALFLPSAHAGTPVDITAPVLSAATVNGSTLTLTYNESLLESEVPDQMDYDVEVAGTYVQVTGVSVAGTTVTLTLGSAAAPGDVVTVSYYPRDFSDYAIMDLALNEAVLLYYQKVTNNTQDITAPTLSAAAVNGSTLIFTYSENLDTNSVPAPTNFMVSIAGDQMAVSNVGVSGTTVTLTLASAAAPGGVVTVSYAVGASPIQDLAGNDAAALTNWAVTNNTPDTTAPVLTAAALYGTTLTLTYSENLNQKTVPNVNDFTVTVASKPVAVSNVAVAGTTVTLTLASAAAPGDVVTVSYAVGANPIQDLAGNDAAGLNNQQVTNIPPDTTAPVLTAADVDGTTLTLTYTENLDTASVSAVTDFTVTVASKPVAVSNVAVTGTTVTLTLASAAVPGDVITVSYAVGASPIRDVVGHDAAALTNQAVTNNTPDTTPPMLLTKVINGKTLVLTFNEALNEAAVPPPELFAVRKGAVRLPVNLQSVQVAGGQVAVSNVAVAGSRVTLTLEGAVAPREQVEVSYSQSIFIVLSFRFPSLQDLAGNRVSPWIWSPVTNITPDPTPEPEPEPVAYVTISAPVTETRDATVSVSGMANPYAVVSVGGTTATASATGSWTAVVTLAEGANAITARNGSASQSISVTRDSTPPVVKVTASEAETFAESVILSASTEAKATLTIAGEGAGTGSGSRTVKLKVGRNTFTATARDPLGNEGSATVTVIRKEQPVEAEVNPEKPSEVSGKDWTINVPAGSTPESFRLTVSPPANSAPADQVGNSAVVAGTAEITAQGQSTNEAIHTFKKKLKVTFRYDPIQFPDPSRLTIRWYDPATKVWVSIGGVADPVAGTITAEVDHFTLFAVFAAKDVAPVIDPLPATTDVKTISVKGKANAGSTVTLVLNGQVVTTGTADTSGAYTMTATLQEGRNQLYVKGSSILASSEAVITFTPAKVTPLKDISGHWAEAAIVRLVGQGVAAGFEDQTYRPELTVTRAQFAALLARALRLKASTDLGRFTDAAAIPDWARSDVAAAAAAGIVKGRADGSFDPAATITRAEAAVMIAGSLRYKGLTATGQTPALSDFAAVPEWAKAGVQAAVHSGIITGYEDGTFKYGNWTTRAQAAVMLNRLLDAR